MKSEFDLLFCLSWAEYFMFVRGLPMQTADAVLQSTPSSQSHAAEFNRYLHSFLLHRDGQSIPQFSDFFTFILEGQFL